MNGKKDHRNMYPLKSENAELVSILNDNFFLAKLTHLLTV